jgi:hypothetical protein
MSKTNESTIAEGIDDGGPLTANNTLRRNYLIEIEDTRRTAAGGAP